MVAARHRIDRTLRRLVPINVTLIGLTAFGMALCLGATPRKIEKAPNPHWNKDSCDTCHLVENGKKLSITPEKADEICLVCHDGRKAAAEFHPVGRTFDNDKYVKPEAWPLADNRLGCLTCHDVKPACDERPRAAGYSNSNRMFLRDYQAGRAQSRPFCGNCHKASAYKRLNPHQMLLADKDEIIEDKCLFCHTKPLDRNTLARSGDQSLKADQRTLCKDCHPQHKDPMQQGHLGLRLTDDVLAQLVVVETTGLARAPAPPLLAQAKASGAKPTKMVPAANGTITCSTCHNPHQRGVFPAESVLSYRAMGANSDGKLISPVRGQTWCRHCHDF